MKYAIGIDLGATNIKALAVTSAGKVLAEALMPTGDSGDKKWRENVRRAFHQVQRGGSLPPAAIGLAAPGLSAGDGQSIAVMPGRLRGLEGLVWSQYLELSNPVPVLNDAQAALLGEIWRGAAKSARNALLLTLGTGVGGAAVVDGRLLRGHIGRAGHFGHISLDPEGAGDMANAPGSLEDSIGDCTIRARSQGRFESTKALVNASRRGDRQARSVWLDSIRALAAGISSLINVLDPEVVVVGGGIARAGAALFRPLREYLDIFEWRPGGQQARVVAAKLGDCAGAFGAAWNALNNPTVTQQPA